MNALPPAVRRCRGTLILVQNLQTSSNLTFDTQKSSMITMDLSEILGCVEARLRRTKVCDKAW